jgi:hypothetical protein
MAGRPIILVVEDDPGTRQLIGIADIVAKPFDEAQRLRIIAAACYGLDETSGTASRRKTRRRSDAPSS